MANRYPDVIFKPVNPRSWPGQGGGGHGSSGGSCCKEGEDRFFFVLLEERVMIGSCHRWKMIVGRAGVPLQGHAMCNQSHGQELVTIKKEGRQRCRRAPWDQGAEGVHKAFAHPSWDGNEGGGGGGPYMPTSVTFCDRQFFYLS